MSRTSQPVRRASAAPAPCDPPAGNLLFWLALGYAAAVIYLLLLPLKFEPAPLAEAWERLGRFTLVARQLERRADWMANVALFVPLGFLWAGAADRGAGAARTLRLAAAGGLAAGLIVAVELVQGWFPPRTVSAGDVAAELLGTGLGAAAWEWAGARVVSEAARLFAADREAARRALLRAYAAALLFYLLQPFDFTFHPLALAEKVRAGRVGLGPPWEALADPVGWVHLLRQAAMTLPVGVLLKLGWDWRGRRRPTLEACLLLVWLVIGVKLVQLFVYSAASHASAAGLMIAGGLLGVVLAKRGMDATGRLSLGQSWPAGRRRWTAWGLGATAVVVAAGVVLPPYRFDWRALGARGPLGGMIAWPFARWYWAGEWTALVTATYALVLLAPLGLLWRWAGGRGGWLAAGLLGAAVGAALELAQAALVDAAGEPLHLADLTMVLLYGAGSAAGYAAGVLFLAPPAREQPPSSAISAPDLPRQDRLGSGKPFDGRPDEGVATRKH